MEGKGEIHERRDMMIMPAVLEEYMEGSLEVPACVCVVTKLSFIIILFLFGGL